MPLPDAAFSGGEQSDSDKIEAYAAGGEALERVRKCVAQCSVQDDAPIVAFVSKVVPVRAVELGEWCATSAYSGGDRDGDVFVAFARVFSGILRPDSDLFVLGPKYHPQRKTTRSHVQALSGEGTLGLFMMMGTSMLPVPCVPAGNLVAIAGLEGLVVKSATLSSTLACPALRAMTLQVHYYNISFQLGYKSAHHTAAK
jgi:ribosome assembly protein 1